MSTPIIAPSILAADFSRLADHIAQTNNAGWLHVDIMDGHFVPNLSFGPDITKTVDKLTDLDLDVHLMIEKPEKWLETYAQAGADTIIVHVEAVDDLVGVARQIHDLGVKAGFSVKPATPIEDYLDVLPEFDEVLIMSVEPGFGGQSFMPDQLTKVRTLRKEIDEKGLSVVLEIDGGINATTIGDAAAAGVDAFVAGSAVYGKEDPAAAVEELAALAAR